MGRAFVALIIIIYRYHNNNQFYKSIILLYGVVMHTIADDNNCISALAFFSQFFCAA
jgi:hypothetical protein